MYCKWSEDKPQIRRIIFLVYSPNFKRNRLSLMGAIDQRTSWRLCVYMDIAIPIADVRLITIVDDVPVLRRTGFALTSLQRSNSCYAAIIRGKSTHA